jgi:hypothetical protein
MTKPRTLFMVGQRAYFLITVDSNLNQDKNIIDFSQIKILTVMVRGEKSDLPTLICEKGQEYNETVMVNIVIHQRSNSREIGFSFDFTNQLTNILLRPNGKKSFITSVELEVSYLNKKRFAFEVLATDTEKSTFSTEVGVEGTKFESNPNTGKNAVNGFSVLAASLLLMIVALFF